MAILIKTHADTPHQRVLKPLATLGKVFAYPSDTGYALGCHIQDSKAIQRIRTLRSLTPQHRFTLVCQDLKTVAQYALMETPTFRMIKAHVPAPTTFVLRALSSTPKQIYHQKRKEIGIRVPQMPLVYAILEQCGGVMLSVSALSHTTGSDQPTSALEIQALYPTDLDYIIETEPCMNQPSSIIDCTQHPPRCLRIGVGDIPPECLKASIL